MRYRLFLLDLDDTLLDFQASERLAFMKAMQTLGLSSNLESLFKTYQKFNLDLWRQFELGKVSKDFLKIERFHRTFTAFELGMDAESASLAYLDTLADTVVLIDGARELLKTLSGFGEVGIITNGVEHIQHKRVASSGLDQHIAFIATSEACGYAKPDTRFFDFTAKLAKACTKNQTIIIGDRLDADILGANRYGIDSCWFNPQQLSNATEAKPTYQVFSLGNIPATLSQY